MSEKIVAGIEVLINKEIEKGITEKLIASCSKYYGKNKEIQNMIPEKNFADTISRVTVVSNDGKVLMRINPKDLNLVDEEYRARFGEVCSEYFSEIVSEYFNHGIDTGNNVRNLTKEKTIEIISEKTRVSQDISKHVVNAVAENLDALSKGENPNTYVANIFGDSLKDTTYEAAIEIIANKWTDLTKSEKSILAEELGGVRNKSYVIALFDHVTEN
ncbi:hypothetical protein [Clostridium sp.]